jgi:uncharacterized protein (TIGR02231 family)
LILKAERAHVLLHCRAIFPNFQESAMRSFAFVAFPIALCVAASAVSRAMAQNSSALQPQVIAIESHISAVTLYRGRASVTRSATAHLKPGVYELQFTNLPESIQPQTLQARASGVIKVLGVDFLQEAAVNAPTSAKVAELDAQIEQLQLQLKHIAEERELIKAQEEFINAVSVRASTDAGKEGGTDKLNLEVVKQQLAYVSGERDRLTNARRELDKKQREIEKELQVLQSKRASLGGASNAVRTAVVSAVAAEEGPASIDLTYLVTNAGWEPSYNIRASLDGSTAVVEYDAVLLQRTGEDWDDVKLTLSTAQPMVAANPPTLQPWFVDVRPKDVVVAPQSRAMAEAAKMPAPAGQAADWRDEGMLRQNLQELAADAEVGGAGPSVTFELPRTVTVKSNIARQQKTRIANIETHPKFVYVAVPMLTDAVYIRGELVNSSAYQFLPGRASIFVGQDYVGPTTLAAVAPNGEFKVHFGIDPAVHASRRLVTKNTENTGLLSGGRRTSYDYRLSIDNGAGKPIIVELWDRYPISRSEDIQIELVDLSTPLATDAKYVAEEKPQGLMKWVLNVPASATGKTPQVVSYGVRINRAKDVHMTPLPE